MKLYIYIRLEPVRINRGSCKSSKLEENSVCARVRKLIIYLLDNKIYY